MTLAVSTEGLCKTYARPFSKREVRALQDLTLDVEPGEIYGLLGPNGAGKTTLLKLLLGIARPSSGQATLFGVPVSRPTSRSPIGFLPENHRFPPFLTAMQSMIVYGRLSDMRSRENRVRAEQLLEEVGLRDWTNVRVGEFSKGMMQRLGLAQALLNTPRLLFLDEPTDGVDPIGRRQIRDLLVGLRGSGMTIFLNSHLLSEVELVCTRVGILHRGRLVRSGTIGELTTGTQLYRFLFDHSERDRLSESFPAIELQPESRYPDRIAGVVKAESLVILNQLIDRIREAGIGIIGIEPDRTSLEAKFMEIIEAVETDLGQSGGDVLSSADHFGDRLGGRRGRRHTADPVDSHEPPEEPNT